MHVHSSDPRKAEIVRLLKAASGATKVTMLKEKPAGVFTGRCLKHEGGSYRVLGDFSVRFPDETAVRP